MDFHPLLCLIHATKILHFPEHSAHTEKGVAHNEKRLKLLFSLGVWFIEANSGRSFKGKYLSRQKSTLADIARFISASIVPYFVAAFVFPFVVDTRRPTVSHPSL